MPFGCETKDPRIVPHRKRIECGRDAIWPRLISVLILHVNSRRHNRREHRSMYCQQTGNTIP